MNGYLLADAFLARSSDCGHVVYDGDGGGVDDVVCLWWWGCSCRGCFGSGCGGVVVVLQSLHGLDVVTGLILQLTVLS